MKNNRNNESAPAIDRAALSILENHKNGRIITDISAALKQVTAAVQLTGKGGSVTLTMKINPASKGDASTLVFLPKVKTSIPESEVPGSIFYADSDFNLVREDPNQAKLDLKEAPAAPAAQPLKEVGAGK